MATILDFSASVPSAASVKAAGHDGAIFYASPGREPWMKGKQPTRAQLDDYDKHGLKFGFVWQYRKGGSINAGDAGRGFEGGVEDAKAAQAYLNKVRCGGHPVYFAVDWDITLAEWNGRVRRYFEGAVSVLGRQRVGIYGHSRVAHWAGPENNVIGEVAPGRFLAWVTQSWGSRRADGTPRGMDYATVFQGTHNVPGPDGVQVDINTVFHDEWGWRFVPAPARARRAQNLPHIKPNPHHRGDPHFLPDVLRAFGVKVKTLPGWDKWGMGDFNKIWGVGVHHTGANNTSAQYIARNPGLSNGLSSQIHLSRQAPFEATLCGVGIAWHMGRGSYPGLPTNNANPLLIGIEPQSNGTDPWPEGMLDIYYRTVAAILWYLGHDSSRCIAHWEYSLVAQGKWDPGAGNGRSGAVMDMNHFRARVQHYIDNPPFMEGISSMALDLNQRHKSRVPGSTWTGTLHDVWLNTDAHAFVARANTEALKEEISTLKKQLTDERKQRRELDERLANSIQSLASAIRKDS